MALERDLRKTALYGAVHSFYAALHAPGEGRVTDAIDLAAAPQGDRLAFSGSIFPSLDRAPISRIVEYLTSSGELEIQSAPDDAQERLPRYSPDGSVLAFLSDRYSPGDPQLCLRHADGSIRAAPQVDGYIESVSWSPNGRRVLLGIAGRGADLAGCQGGAKTRPVAESLPGWIPVVDTGDAVNLWRTAAVIDTASGTVTPVAPAGHNLWEVTWLDDARILAVTSGSHGEGTWYQSRLVAIDIQTQRVDEIYRPKDQIAVPAVSPSADTIALVESVASDRLVVCGPLVLIDLKTGTSRQMDTAGVDVTHVVWRDRDTLCFVGHQGLATVVCDLYIASTEARVRWSSLERTFGPWYPTLALGANGTAFVLGEGYAQPPELATLDVSGTYTALHSLATRTTATPAFNTGRIEPFEWQGRDELTLQGWVVRPAGEGPWPLVMDIHGGPVWMCRNRWQGRLRGAKLLADLGIASFYPNPRGSSGRGVEFAAEVRGDMGGEDTFDYLTGIDALVAAGIADPERLGVTGISYGGFMSAWLITQDSRFAAAVPISTVADWVSQHYTSQIPYFDARFLDGQPNAMGGLFHSRSPIHFASRVQTPTLQLTGALDQNTPPTQALEFHRALQEHGVRSVLATYPTAGHGIRSFPEVLDATTRYVGWFAEHFAIPIPP